MTSPVEERRAPAWTLVVLGDCCRSPRMCYHSLSLADKGATVNLVGYYGRATNEGDMRRMLGERVFRSGSSLFNPYSPVAVRPPPDFVDSLPSSVLRYGLKVLWTLVALTIVLLKVVPSGGKSSGRSSSMLLQNPPGLPAMLVCWLVARLKGAQYYVDWHNYTYTMLAHKMGAMAAAMNTIDQSLDRLQSDTTAGSSGQSEGHSSSGESRRSKSRARTPKPADGRPAESNSTNAVEQRRRLGLLPRIAQKLEHYLASKADGHLCVSKAMRTDLADNWNVRAVTLYDRPPRWRFSSASVEERHSFFTKLASELMYAPFVCTQVSSDEYEANRFTYRDGSSAKVRTRGLGRPALLVSSTSWTADEDFTMLLCALKLYDDRVTAERHKGDGDLAERLPHIVMVITGKGPLKETYMRLANHLAYSHVELVTPWLKSEDYPRMLQAADLGVCLHTSTSGLDLPMKVVDMHGCGLPALCYRYGCIDELVAENETGRTFADAAELADVLVDLLTGFPEHSKVAFGVLVQWVCNRPQELARLRKCTLEHRDAAPSWEDCWDATVWPLVQA